MNFREQLAEDFRNILANTDEVGRMCDWNGSPLRVAEDLTVDAVVDSAIGLYADQKKIICLACDFESLPRPTDFVMMDGNMWQIHDVQPRFAFLHIHLVRQRSS